MFENRIRHIRLAKGLSPQQLAEAGGITVPALLRIEFGLQHVRFDVLVKLCAALRSELADLFPSVATQLQTIRRARTQETVSKALDRFKEEVEMAGIDFEPASWGLHVHLRGPTEHVLPVSGPECRRVRRLICEHERKQFVVLTSGSAEYAIATQHLIACQFLFDMPSRESHEDENSRNYKLKFFLTDRFAPLEFDIHPDSKDLANESASDWSVQMQNLFYRADADFNERINFMDVNGEEVSIKSSDVAMFSAPLTLIYPALWDAESEYRDIEG